jgi:hypothetical protein
MSDKQDGFRTDQMEREVAPSALELIAPPKHRLFHDGLASAGSSGGELGFVVLPQFPDIEEAVEDETIKEFLTRRIRRCKAIASSFAESKRQSDQNAREVLIEVAETVFSPRFDLDQACEILGVKITKSARRSPCKFLIQMTYPDRDMKVVSKQSIALGYALQQCQWNIDKLREYFQSTSIKQCLREYRSAKADDRKDKTPTASRLVLRGVPDGLSGDLVIRIAIEGASARFVSLVDESGSHPVSPSQ